MTTIAVNLGNVVSTFADLPLGSYLGEITKAKLLPPRQAGKFAQLMVTYMVIDGDHLNGRQSQFLSFSPNAQGFMKEFFEKFGLGDLDNLEFDPDTEELLEPNIVGSKVIFKNEQDKKDADRVRTSLVSVEENTAEAPSAVAPVSTVARAAKPAPAPEPEAAPADDKEARRQAKIAAAQAALAAAQADDDDEDEAEEEPAAPAPAARTAAPRPAATPQRRTLR